MITARQPIGRLLPACPGLGADAHAWSLTKALSSVGGAARTHGHVTIGHPVKGLLGQGPVPQRTVLEVLENADNEVSGLGGDASGPDVAVEAVS